MVPPKVRACMCVHVLQLMCMHPGVATTPQVSFPLTLAAQPTRLCSPLPCDRKPVHDHLCRCPLGALSGCQNRRDCTPVGWGARTRCPPCVCRTCFASVCAYSMFVYMDSFVLSFSFYRRELCLNI